VVDDELLEKLNREGRAPRTLAKTRWLLDFAYEAFGDRPIADITARWRAAESRATFSFDCLGFLCSHPSIMEWA
jgi:hypothetical protein